MSRRFALGLAVAVVALTTGCGHSHAKQSRPSDSANLLRAYLQLAPPERSGLDPDEHVTDVSCSPTGERYKTGNVFDCTISLSTRSELEWCVAVFGDKLLRTQNEDPDIPCTGFSQPSMEGPQ